MPASIRPRILHLLTSFEVGGTERQAVALLKGIDRDRFDVRLSILNRRGPLHAEIEREFPEIGEYPLRSFHDANAARQLLRFVQYLRREQIDIVHTHDFYAGMLGGAAARIAGAKWLAAQRHLKLSDLRRHSLGTSLIQQYSDRMLVNSEAIRDHILATGRASASKIIVIRNGIAPHASPLTPRRDALCRQLGLSPESLIIGLVARLEPVKGHRYFLAAAAQVARSAPRAQFLLVGDGSLRGEIERTIAELGLAGRIHLLGERADAAELSSTFDIAVLSSLHEGLPNSVMEAMAWGVPVIATSVGGTCELIRDSETGYLVAPGDADALAARISHALANERERREVAERGRRFILAEYGMSRMVREVERLYTEMISGGRGGRG